jgi:enoyl-CoA hydratase
MERGLIDEIVHPAILLDRALDRANALAALPPAAFAVTKQQIRQLAFDRIKADARYREIEQIWTAPDTLDRIRDYVTRTLRK